MSKLLANQISNYNDNGPVEVKDGVNIPTGKPLQVAGASGTSGQYLTSTGSSIAWSTFPSIPAAQVNSNWNATSGVQQILNKPNLSPVATSGNYSDLSGLPTLVTTLNGLNDVNTAGLVTNKILQYNGSQWVVADPASGADGNTTYTQSSVADSTNVKLRLTGSGGTNDDILITAGTNIGISNVTANGFTLSSVGATCTTSDSSPSTPSDGDLWWKSDEGRLKVYYSDGSSNQWVDASPPANSGPRYRGTAAFTNFQTNPQGTWTGAGITATYGAISNPSGYGSFQFTFTMDHNYGDTDSYLILAQGHFNNDSTAGRGTPLVVNMEKVNGTTFIGTVSDPDSGTNIDDAKFDLFVFDA